jgi:hypothetical protein
VWVDGHRSKETPDNLHRKKNGAIVFGSAHKNLIKTPRAKLSKYQVQKVVRKVKEVGRKSAKAGSDGKSAGCRKMTTSCQAKKSVS